MPVSWEKLAACVTDVKIIESDHVAPAAAPNCSLEGSIPNKGITGKASLSVEVESRISLSLNVLEDDLWVVAESLRASLEVLCEEFILGAHRVEVLEY